MIFFGGRIHDLYHVICDATPCVTHDARVRTYASDTPAAATVFQCQPTIFLFLVLWKIRTQSVSHRYKLLTFFSMVRYPFFSALHRSHVNMHRWGNISRSIKERKQRQKSNICWGKEGEEEEKLSSRASCRCVPDKAWMAFSLVFLRFLFHFPILRVFLWQLNEMWLGGIWVRQGFLFWQGRLQAEKVFVHTKVYLDVYVHSIYIDSD